MDSVRSRNSTWMIVINAVKDHLVACARSVSTQVGLVFDKDLRELRSHVLHGLTPVSNSFQLMDCLIMSFSCAEVVLGVSLHCRCDGGRARGPPRSHEAERARHIAQADQSPRRSVCRAYTANSSTRV